MPHIQNSTAQGLVEVDHTTGSRPQPGYSDGLSLSGNRRDGTANPPQELLGFDNQNHNTGVSRTSLNPIQAPSSSVHSQEEWNAASETPTGLGIFNNARDFVIKDPIFIGREGDIYDTFMKDFAKHTIRGAAVDSSARDPPPRCHPGTRLSTIDEKRALCMACPPPKRLAWIVGPAGVGKSAIMQTVAETSPNLGAALFFSVNGRNDSTKAIATLAYQLATKFPHYLDYIRVCLTKDPTIFDKAIPVQFNEFITEPFANRRIYRGTHGVLPGCAGGGYDLGIAAEWLRMTPEIAYGCLHHLHSVLHIPPTPEDAVQEGIEVHHKSFKDYLAKKYPGAKEEFEKVALDAAVAILKEISQSMYQIACHSQIY
ncbi:hypothetical protein AN958_07849 [Leucoagaricus sp. SymC.cos]|nr:hypothetical protein AN958_07849 [Leucoagaricus sp. SymC.cos]